MEQPGNEAVNGGLVFAEEFSLAGADVDDDAHRERKRLYEGEMAYLNPNAVVIQSKFASLKIEYGVAGSISHEDRDGNEGRVCLKDRLILGNQTQGRQEYREQETPLRRRTTPPPAA